MLGKASRNRGRNAKRIFSASDDEILIKRMERKMKNVIAQDVNVDKDIKGTKLDGNK